MYVCTLVLCGLVQYLPCLSLMCFALYSSNLIGRYGLYVYPFIISLSLSLSLSSLCMSAVEGQSDLQPPPSWEEVAAQGDPERERGREGEGWMEGASKREEEKRKIE